MRIWPADWGGPSPALRPGGCAWALLQVSTVGRQSTMCCWASSPIQHSPGAWAAPSKRSKPGGNGWEYLRPRRNEVGSRGQDAGGVLGAIHSNENSDEPLDPSNLLP